MVVLTLLLDDAPGIGGAAGVSHVELTGQPLVVDLFVESWLKSIRDDHGCSCGTRAWYQLAEQGMVGDGGSFQSGTLAKILMQSSKESVQKGRDWTLWGP